MRIREGHVRINEDGKLHLDVWKSAIVFSLFSAATCCLTLKVFHPFWVDSSVWCKIGVQFHSFACVSSFPSAIFWRGCPFPFACYWLLYYKLIDQICVDSLLGSLFYCINLYICFYASIILFWLVKLCSIVRNQQAEMPIALLFFPIIALAIQGLLWFHINFRTVFFYFHEKCLWNFNGYALNLSSALKYQPFNNINSSNSWA